MQQSLSTSPSIPVSAIRERLKAFAFVELFNDLGWEYLRTEWAVEVKDRAYLWRGVAEKRSFQVLVWQAAEGEAMPDRATRQQIGRAVSRLAREHLLIFVDAAKTRQIWHWSERLQGQPLRTHEHELQADQSGEQLAQRLAGLFIRIDEDDESLTVLDVSGRVRGSLAAERVTRRFYDRFKQEHEAFRSFVAGIQASGDRDWYASLMLNRLMFVYFIQKKGFLDGDVDYLRHKLAQVRAVEGEGQFLSFYRRFLQRLFHEGLSKQRHERGHDLDALIGQVPYLNGGLFDVHALEQAYPEIDVPDEAFDKLFGFFDEYRWHLDERPIGNENEINPDVLGYIFEKYINQKQMGAYYTKEDITEYIGKNTIVPAILDRAKEACAIAFRAEGALWGLLREDPDRYIYPAVRQETDKALPPAIAAGLHDVTQRGEWNRPADEGYALPTETWREHVARRQRYEDVWLKLAEGEVTAVDDLITLNLDLRQFAQDAIAGCEGPETLRAFWKAIGSLSVLDPTCGSGAFLFAALNILQPLAEECLDRMQAFVDELDAAGGAYRPEKFADFRRTLDEVAAHPNREYFVLKQIVLNNLYGVDIMAEAVEICKLRLFLKLVAQLEDAGQIEPLPDIDFNIRAGNTLVGFVSLDEVERSLHMAGAQQLRMIDDATLGELGRMQEEAEKAAMASARFRDMQEERTSSAAQREAKQEVRKRLGALRAELDVLQARLYGIEPDGEKYNKWKESHQPFHWLSEFYEIVHDRGGFDAIIGNPPYVGIRSIEYRLGPVSRSRYPDIYAYVVERCLGLQDSNGRIGVIIPLSVTFSGDYADLRRVLLSSGQCWFSSFDNIPDAVFDGVSQRCTIVLANPRTSFDTYSAPMYRWRSAYRPYLTSSISYVNVTHQATASFGVPKLGSSFETTLMGQFLECLAGNAEYSAPRDTGYRLGFAPAARNFISVYVEPPPVVALADFRQLTHQDIGSIPLASDSSLFTGLALTAGDLFFWYWLVRGDGFHVTSWVIRDYLAIQYRLASDHISLLSELGRALHSNRFYALVFKKNAGKYIGNFNYISLRALTRRADLIAVEALGLDAKAAVELFDLVDRVRSINVSAGERGIPEALKAQFSSEGRASELVPSSRSEIDQFIRSSYGFTDEELDFIINYDITYRMGRDGASDEG